MKAVTPARSNRSARFWVQHSWLEPLIFVALALAYEWVVYPVASALVKVVFLTVVALIPLASNVLHRDRPHALGFRFDNFLRSARMVGPATLVALAIILSLSYASGHGVTVGVRLGQQLWYYPLWGLAQQWVLQGFVHRRLRESWRHRRLAAVGSSVLFSSLHFPNPALMVFTLIGGYAWCRYYQKEQNLFTLALSHGWLGAIALVSLPRAWMHGLRVGPEFWG
jgi:membrane protease YdiL (CAAX protease family)